MHLIVGLGNPGRRYAKTRHNVGYMMIDHIAGVLGEKVERLHGRSLICATDLAGTEVLLAKPQTYMNLSGYAVKELVKNERFELSRCLVIYDEVSLPLGKLRLRPSGSAGGHKGMQSVLQTLGTQQVPRLRIGIAPEQPVEDLTDHVLSRFRADEWATLEEVSRDCLGTLETLLTRGIDQAMTQFN